MKTRWGRGIAISLGLLALPIAASTAFADSQKMWLACENGHNYPIRPLAVSREYDLVTGYLLTTGRGHAVHLRLVPMGVGYRYEGAGVWFDGLRGEAVLNWGSPRAVPCAVMQE